MIFDLEAAVRVIFAMKVKDILRAIGKEAKVEEDALNHDLTDPKKTAKGQAILSLPIVDADADSVTLLVEIPGLGIPFQDFVKITLLRTRIKFDRKFGFNLTSSKDVPVKITDIPNYTVEMTATKKDSYELKMGGGKEPGFNQFEAELTIKSPLLYLKGYYAQSKLGFLISLEGYAKAIMIPIGPTPFGFMGFGVLFGEHFAPDLRKNHINQDVMAALEDAGAQDYVGWLRKSDLDKWQPVDPNIVTFGLSATVGDVATGGNWLRFENCGFLVVSYGPTLILKTDVVMPMSLGRLEMTGAIDVRSQSMYMQVTFSIAFPLRNTSPPQPDDGKAKDPGKDKPANEPVVVEFSGSIEFSMSMKDVNKCWLASGGFEMKGNRVVIIGILEMNGGWRIVLAKGMGARAGAHAEGHFSLGRHIEIGYEFACEILGEIGWNPFFFGFSLHVPAMSVYVKVYGKQFGFSASIIADLYLWNPRYFVLYAEFEVSAWFFKTTVPLRLFEITNSDVGHPKPPVDFFDDAVAIRTVHAPSGTNKNLTKECQEIWPDVMLDLPFERDAVGPGNIVNPLSGKHTEGRITVTHTIETLKIVKVDSAGNEVDVPTVSASWMLVQGENGATASSRLAIPCNAPLEWLTAFHDATPGSIDFGREFRFQGFGAGFAEYFAVDSASKKATVRAERVLVESPGDLLLVPTLWAQRYGRVLTGSEELSISVKDGVPSAVFDYVSRFWLRIFVPPAASGSPPSSPDLLIREGGKLEFYALVQTNADGISEFLFSVRRDPADYTKPLRISGLEKAIHLAAVGYELDWASLVQPGQRTILERGHYRLKLTGSTRATKDGNNHADTAWPVTSRDFTVVDPPLRPYLRFATFGDERIFGLEAGIWNPNPKGAGFGHYGDYLGVVRSSVGYLAAIYKTVSVQAFEGDDLQTVCVLPARDHTIAGTKASQNWKKLAGIAPEVESEFTFNLPKDKGEKKITIYHIDDTTASDSTIAAKDQWTYRVSAYPNAAMHLKPKALLSWSFGPSGGHTLNTAEAKAMPAGFDWKTIQEAKSDFHWKLPKQMAELDDILSERAGLAFLSIIELAGAFSLPSAQHENVLAIPKGPELCLLMDVASSPVALLWRSSEPVDWRRVTLNLVVGHPEDTEDTEHFRHFATRLVPGPDGCSCLVLLIVEGQPVRVPSGRIAMQVAFHLALPNLPRLTMVDTPDTTEENFEFAVNQPFGPAWPV